MNKNGYFYIILFNVRIMCSTFDSNFTFKVWCQNTGQQGAKGIRPEAWKPRRRRNEMMVIFERGVDGGVVFFFYRLPELKSGWTFTLTQLHRHALWVRPSPSAAARCTRGSSPQLDTFFSFLLLLLLLLLFWIFS